MAKFKYAVLMIVTGSLNAVNWVFCKATGKTFVKYTLGQ